ncbi:hypothetical protein AAG607_10565 [Citromicrobium bathyomarinum]|uniref:hypothetical protein n=1 Tax=Sphingomonadales TaxID=204457 RepID=UPI001A39EAB7|nr:hypothetical protein [Citromicrobium sp.]
MKRKAAFFLSSMLALSACATTEGGLTSGNHASDGLVAALGPCAYVDGQTESLAVALGTAVAGDALDFVIGALKDAADPEKGTKTSTAAASYNLENGLPNCLYVAKGRMSVFAPDGSQSNKPPISPLVLGSQPPPKSVRGSSAQIEGDVSSGGDLPGENAGDAAEIEERGKVLAGADAYDREADFSQVGLYFLEQPDMVAVFALDRTKDSAAARLRPVYASYHDAPKGALFRTAKSRDVIVTLELSSPGADSAASFGPLPLGRLLPSDDSHIVYSSRGAVKRSLVQSKWVKLPEALRTGKTINATVTLAEVQAPNFVAGYIGGVLEESKDELNEEIKQLIDADAARQARIAELTAQNTNTADYRTKLITACTKSQAAIDAFPQGATARAPKVSEAIAAQEEANVAALKIDLASPFPTPWTLSGFSSSTTQFAACASIVD